MKILIAPLRILLFMNILKMHYGFLYKISITTIVQNFILNKKSLKIFLGYMIKFIKLIGNSNFL